VVADEVRNLAMRAAEAARSTSGLMEDIVKKVKNGEILVDQANEAFGEVTGSSQKTVNLVSEIAAASQEQSQGIDQVNKAVAEMNQTTQHNAASAEELASIMALFRTNGESGRVRTSPVLRHKEPFGLKGKPGEGIGELFSGKMGKEETTPAGAGGFKSF
jgi:hypothetical protein